MTRYSFYGLALTVCLAATAYAVGAVSWPAAALALTASLAIAFSKPEPFRWLLREFEALGAHVRRELAIYRVRANAWLQPA